ncbi:DNA gyrase subunit B [Kitasatospora sp. NPDC059646]|uniref:DNA gyrase subunit B n=1 Tax=Kitasatospora sp. NPDC059646 TaxID=3346893 RepID=UPI0036BF9134
MSEYDGISITVLTGLEAVRKRPGMYIGSTGERGLHHLLSETVEKAATEVLHGRARTVDVTLLADGSARVTHDGLYRHSPAEELMVMPTSWRPTGGRHSIGVLRVGLFVVNALSDRLVAEERRDGVTVRQEYSRGETVTAPHPTDVLTGGTGSDIGTGTTIVFRPDPAIFGAVSFDRAALAARFRELAVLNRTLELTLTDERGTAPHAERFHAPGGVREYLATLGADPAEAVIVEREDPRMSGSMEIAIAPSGPDGPQLAEFANSFRTHGGTHVQGFRDGVAAALGADARPTAVVSVKLDAPEFEGSCRDVLGNGAVRACVAEAVQHALETWR